MSAQSTRWHGEERLWPSTLAHTYADCSARLEVERECLAILELEHVFRV